MTSDAQRRFTRALRSLDGPAFVDFVAALWTARGRRATAAPRGVVEADGGAGRESSTLRVLGTGAVTASFLARPKAADVVVTRGRVGRAAVRVARRLRPDARFEHVDAGGLYERFAHAVGDAERRRLWERHLRAGADRPAVGVRLAGGAERVRTILPSGALAATAALVLVVVGAATGAVVDIPSDGRATSQFDGDAGSVGGPNGTPTAAPTPTATSTPRAIDLPSACPPPPADAHPVDVKPGVVRTASTSGLEGWEVRLEQNVTDFDPNDEQRSVFPSVRHFAVYESPSERQYRLVIGRWDSPNRAVTQVRKGGKGGADAVVAWGSYVVSVRAYADDAPDRTRADARQLLANLQTADGVRLGHPCVDALTAGVQRWSNRSR